MNPVSFGVRGSENPLRILQDARIRVLDARPYNEGAFWILCSAINHVSGLPGISTVELFLPEPPYVPVKLAPADVWLAEPAAPVSDQPEDVGAKEGA